MPRALASPSDSLRGSNVSSESGDKSPELGARSSEYEEGEKSPSPEFTDSESAWSRPAPGDLRRFSSPPGVPGPGPPVPTLVVTGPPGEDPATPQTRMLFQRSLSSPDGLRGHASPVEIDSLRQLGHVSSLGQEYSVTLADVARYKQLGEDRRVSSGTGSGSEWELSVKGEEVWSRTDTESIGASGEEEEEAAGQQQGNTGRWKRIQLLVRSASFTQTINQRKYQWVQLAGHPNSFLGGESPGTVLKRAGAAEGAAYVALMADPLREVVPAFHGRRNIAGTDYLEIQCCLAQFQEPCMMDVKMGTRTTLIPLEPSLHRPRQDLFEKMVKQDPSAATPEEAAEGAVTKRRYLDWRDAASSSAGLGLRIEGTRVAGSSCHDYKATRTRDQVSRALQAFVQSRQTRDMYLKRLRTIRTRCLESSFFSSHDIIGSSLLFVHDRHSAGIWMIDFEKTRPRTTHPKKPSDETTRPDGYLVGLDSIIALLSGLILPDIQTK